MHTAALYRGEGEILEILLFCLLINFQDCRGTRSSQLECATNIFIMYSKMLLQ